VREGAPQTPAPSREVLPDGDGLRELVWDVLVKQLGHRPGEASQLIADALKRRPGIGSAEELFDEIYRGAKAS
jgi:Holliday junction DNA helicase RuvA